MWLLTLYDILFPLPSQKSTKGSVVLDYVFSHVNLVESDYFGLRYCDRSHQTVSTGCP